MNSFRRMVCSAGRQAILFCFGGALYYGIEVLFRGYSHPLMAVLGGLLFLVIGALNEGVGEGTPLAAQGIASSVVITLAEFVSGLILNVWLKLGIWDYSDLPLNLLGQICVQFSLAWIFVGMLAVVVDDVLRHILFGEPMPRYRLF